MYSNRRVVGITLAVVVVAVLVTIVALDGPVGSLLVRDTSFPSTGNVKAVGVGVYWDSACSDRVASIDWGMLEPGSSKNVTCYIRNEGNSALTLSMYTSNWNPLNASDCMSLSWDYGGQSINPGEVVQVMFTLSVFANIEGITSFSFDITIVGTG